MIELYYCRLCKVYLPRKQIIKPCHCETCKCQITHDKYNFSKDSTENHIVEYVTENELSRLLSMLFTDAKRKFNNGNNEA